ncbi:hypothetical protein AB0G74_30650 [Streptomyces sp. NPDC020875]|uniref:hypothetical protein n=1 Tax=Streptomyces sp. NPDC020875 TaxID=3154898 RepID=UPI00340CE839
MQQQRFFVGHDPDAFRVALADADAAFISYVSRTDSYHRVPGDTTALHELTRWVELKHQKCSDRGLLRWVRWTPATRQTPQSWETVDVMAESGGEAALILEKTGAQPLVTMPVECEHYAYGHLDVHFEVTTNGCYALITVDPDPLGRASSPLHRELRRKLQLTGRKPQPPLQWALRPAASL